MPAPVGGPPAQTPSATVPGEQLPVERDLQLFLSGSGGSYLENVNPKMWATPPSLFIRQRRWRNAELLQTALAAGRGLCLL